MKIVSPEVIAALLADHRGVRSPGLRERLLNSAVQPGWLAWTGRVASLWDLSEEAVRAEFAKAASADAWGPSPVPTVMAFHLSGGPATAGADVGLVRIPDGFQFPHHGHGECEEYVVLQGCMRFPDGHREHPGDRIRNDGAVCHRYFAEGEVIVAIVLRGGLTAG